MTVDKKYAGTKFTIIHCKGALESFTEAISGLPKNKQGSFTRGMILPIKKLANGHPMSKENFPSEGLLPGIDHHAQTEF